MARPHNMASSIVPSVNDEKAYFQVGTIGITFSEDRIVPESESEQACNVIKAASLETIGT